MEARPDFSAARCSRAALNISRLPCPTKTWVIESHSQNNLPFPLVAIYPKEGTFWSDHPIGIVEREIPIATDLTGAGGISLEIDRKVCSDESTGRGSVRVRAKTSNLSACIQRRKS
jgi:hypothetical protein